MPGVTLEPQLRPEFLGPEPAQVVICGAASALYDSGRQKILEGSIASLTDIIKVALVTNAYSPAPTTDIWYTAISANVVGTDQTLGSVTTTAGVFDAADSTWSGGAAPPSSATPITYVVIYKSTGTAGTSPLIGIIDTATNLPLTPNGGSVVMQWANTSNRIFKL
jgi:hypothetical protein